MRVEDYFANGKRWWVRLHEKGGKRHEMPAHHKLEAYLDEYVRAAGTADDKGPLFRSARDRTGELTVEPMHRVDAWRMVQRRAAELGMKVKIGIPSAPSTATASAFSRKAKPETETIDPGHFDPPPLPQGLLPASPLSDDVAGSPLGEPLAQPNDLC
jgi:hypothetical protein